MVINPLLQMTEALKKWRESQDGIHVQRPERRPVMWHLLGSHIVKKSWQVPTQKLRVRGRRSGPLVLAMLGLMDFIKTCKIRFQRTILILHKGADRSRTTPRGIVLEGPPDTLMMADRTILS